MGLCFSLVFFAFADVVVVVPHLVLLLFFLSLEPPTTTSYVYSHNTGLQAQSVMYTVASPGGDEKPTVLLDPNKLSKDGTVRSLFSLFRCSTILLFFLLLPLTLFRANRNQSKSSLANTRSPWEAPPSATTAR